jgi:hypothetical protein
MKQFFVAVALLAGTFAMAQTRPTAPPSGAGAPTSPMGLGQQANLDLNLTKK